MSHWRMHSCLVPESMFDDSDNIQSDSNNRNVGASVVQEAGNLNGGGLLSDFRLYFIS